MNNINKELINDEEFDLICNYLKIRYESKLSQRELASKVGIAQSTIARMEKNMHSMSIGNFCKLLSVLGYKLEIVKEKKMNKDKIETISNLFENKEIRSIWDKDNEDYYYSVVDVINALTDSANPRNYWNMLKSRLTAEGSELYTYCVQLKKNAKDGKSRLTDTLNTEGIFRLIESVPSSKAEPFKVWLAKLGRQKVDEVFDPSKGIDQMIDFYLKKGYSLEWIEARIKAIIDRKKLTNIWHDGGIKDNSEYAILTNAIYKEWSGMTVQDYKAYKGIRKENLRDNMTDIEVALTNIGEIAARDIAREEQPQGLNANVKVAKRGGSVAKAAKASYEREVKKSAISKDNFLDYKYIDKNKKIGNK